MPAKEKKDPNTELAAIVKRQEAKIEKLQKTIEEKNEKIRQKDSELSKVDEKIANLQDTTAQAQIEVQKTDERHSEEMTLVLECLKRIESKLH